MTEDVAIPVRKQMPNITGDMENAAIKTATSMTVTTILNPSAIIALIYRADIGLASSSEPIYALFEHVRWQRLRMGSTHAASNQRIHR